MIFKTNLLQKFIFKPKIIIRCLKDHAYINDINFKSLSHLKDHILENIIYNKDGIVILPKPYGIGKDRSKKTINNTNFKILEGIDFYINDCMQDISKNLKYDSLEIIKSTERYTQGVVVATVPEKKDIVSKYLETREEIYSTVCIGKLNPKEGQVKLGLIMQKNDDNFTYPCLVENWTKGQLKRNEVRIGMLEYKTKATSNNASLVNIHTSLTRGHFLRLFHLYFRTAILGDNLFGSRINWLFNQAIFIDPVVANQKSNKIPNEILQCLDLRNGQENLIPVHLYLKQLNIPKLKFSKKFPYPKYFDFTINRLQLL